MLIIDQDKSIKKDILSYIAITLLLLISYISITFNEIVDNNIMYVVRLVSILVVMLNLCLFLGLRIRSCGNIIPYIVIEIINIVSLFTFMICMGNPFFEIFDETGNKIIALAFISISLIFIYKGFVTINSMHHNDYGVDVYLKQSNKAYLVYSSIFIAIFVTLSLIDCGLNNFHLTASMYLSGIFIGFIFLQIIFKSLFLGNSQEIFCTLTKSLLLAPMISSYYFGATLLYGYNDKFNFFMCIVTYVIIIANIVGDWIFIFKNFKQRIA